MQPTTTEHVELKDGRWGMVMTWGADSLKVALPNGKWIHVKREDVARYETLRLYGSGY